MSENKHAVGRCWLHDSDKAEAFTREILSIVDEKIKAARPNWEAARKLLNRGSGAMLQELLDALAPESGENVKRCCSCNCPITDSGYNDSCVTCLKRVIHDREAEISRLTELLSPVTYNEGSQFEAMMKERDDANAKLAEAQREIERLAGSAKENPNANNAD